MVLADGQCRGIARRCPRRSSRRNREPTPSLPMQAGGVAILAKSHEIGLNIPGERSGISGERLGNWGKGLGIRGNTAGFRGNRLEKQGRRWECGGTRRSPGERAGKAGESSGCGGAVREPTGKRREPVGMAGEFAASAGNANWSADCLNPPRAGSGRRFEPAELSAFAGRCELRPLAAREVNAPKRGE
jgi:hypothetical protein